MIQITDAVIKTTLRHVCLEMSNDLSVLSTASVARDGLLAFLDEV